MKEYMSIAGPSVLSFLVEFATFDIQIFLMGIVGVISQASMVIFMNISVQVFAIYFGISIACATLVGHHIGNNEAKEAKRYHMHVMIFSSIVYTIVLCILWFCQEPIWRIFSTTKDLDYTRTLYYYGFFFMTCLDYWQVILSGTFRALGEMKSFSKFNFITYFVIILGLSVYFSLYTGHHTYINEDKTIHKQKKGYGPMGTWYAFICGLTFQFICEITLLFFFIDWDKCAQAAFDENEVIIEEAIIASARGGDSILGNSLMLGNTIDEANK